jgi:hypothetical protein
VPQPAPDEAPKELDRSRETPPRTLPRPGFAGGAADMRGDDGPRGPLS